MHSILNILFSGPFLKLLIYGAAFLFAFVLAYELTPDTVHAEVRKRLGMTDEGRRTSRETILRIFRPFYLLLTPRIAERDFSQQRARLSKQLIAANLQEEMNPDEFIAFKIVMAIFVPILLGYISGAIGTPIPLAFWPAVVVGGFFFPELWLKQKIQARRRAIIRAMPYTLDLLTLSVEAGLDFIAAIQRLTQRAKTNPLLAEFNQLLKEIRLGTSRSDALRTMSDRLQIEEITSFTTLLIQADQLGASIGSVLRAQSDQLRTARFQAAEAAGARASQLVLFPLVLCIFPALFIIVLGPTLIGFLQKGLF